MHGFGAVDQIYQYFIHKMDSRKALMRNKDSIRLFEIVEHLHGSIIKRMLYLLKVLDFQ